VEASSEAADSAEASAAADSAEASSEAADSVEAVEETADSVEAAEEEAASSPQPTIRVERASATSNMHTVSFFIFDLLKIFIV
jgi:hypothetical protein